MIEHESPIHVRLDDVAVLLDRADYPGAEAMLRRMDSESPGAAALLWIEWALANNRFPDAADHAARALVLPLPPDHRIQIELWRHYLASFQNLPVCEGSTWEEAESAFEAASHSSSPTVKALAVDFAAQFANLRFTLVGGNRETKRSCGVRHEASAHAWAAAGDSRKSFRSRIRLADLHASSPYQDLAGGIEELEHALRETEGQPVGNLRGDAALRLAELRFRQANIGVEAADSTSIWPYFERAEQIYEAGGYLPRKAKVLSSLARCLMEHEVAEGANLAEQAISAYESLGDATQSHDLLSALHLWHVRHGNAEKARELHARMEEPARRIGIPLGQTVHRQAAADRHLRAGRFVEALDHLETADDGAENAPRAANALLRFSTLQRAGRLGEAIEVLEAILPHLEASDSHFLPPALTLMGEASAANNIDASQSYYLRAAALHRERGAEIEEVQQYQQLAFSLAVWRQSRQMRPVRSPEVTEYFERAEAILGRYRTADAWVQRTNLHTHRGLAAFYDDDLPACGAELQRSEEILRVIGLKPELAFICSQQALVLTQVGRSQGVTFYDRAYELLTEAERLFDVAGMRERRWHVRFLLGLTQHEAARWEAPDGPERRRRLELAREHYEIAAEEADWLRGTSADKTASDAEYTSRSAWAESKQAFYRSGLQMALDGLGDFAYAFQWVERMKSRALLDAVRDHLPHEAENRNPLVVRSEELDSIQAGAITREEGREVAARIDENLRALAQDPATRRYAELRSNDALSYEAFRASLEDGGVRDTLVVSYVVTDGAVLAFGTRPEWSTPRFMKLPIPPREVDKVHGYTKSPAQVRFAFESVGEAPWQAIAPLIDPILKWSVPEEHVCLIPYGGLHNLPIHTLRTGPNAVRLVDRNPVSYAPSASVLAGLLRRSRPDPLRRFAKAAVFGDSLGDRRQAKAEARGVADLLSVRPRIGRRVTRDAVLHALRDSSWFHLAGHGKAAAEDGLDSFIRLAADDPLTARELIVTPIGCRAIVLSGCETGVPFLAAGDEAVGLPLALLHAGASTLVNTLWTIDDRCTELFMNTFYRRLTGDSSATVSDAWRAAVREISQTDRWSNPFYWGAFVLAGDWRT